MPGLRRPAGARSGYRLSFRYKAGSINPYPVHDDRQLAGYGHLGPALTDVLGKRQPPALQGRGLGITGQNHIGGLKKMRAQQAIAAS